MIGARRRVTNLLVLGLGVAAAVALGTLDLGRTQDAKPSTARRAVADWSLIAQNAIVGVGRKFPGKAAVYMGIVHAAIYDVVADIEGRDRPFAITTTPPPTTSVDAAVAAHRVLVGRFPDQRASLNEVYVAYLNGIPDAAAKTNGVLVGEEVGVGMRLLRANDGLDRVWPYVQRTPAPGVYEPTAATTPLGTQLPGALPLALEQASQFRPNGPPHCAAGTTREISTK